MIRIIINKIARKVYIQAAIFFVIFIFFAYFVNLSRFNNGLDIIFAIASFLYGFYVVSSISKAKDQHEAVIKHLKESESIMITVNGLMSVFDKKSRQMVLKKIDQYMIATIDYTLADYVESNKDAVELMNTLQHLKPSNDDQEKAKNDSITAIEGLIGSRVEIEASTKEKVAFFEWIIMLILFSIIIFFILTIPNTSLEMLIVVLKSIIATTLFMMLLILRSYDNYEWNTNTLIWDRVTQTFLEIGLLPYYSEFILSLNEYKPPKGIKYRVAHYKNPYPDVVNKTIEIVDTSNTD